MIKVVFFDINDTLVNHSHAQNIAISRMATFLPENNEVEFIRIWKELAKRHWELFEKKKISFEEQRSKRIESVWSHFKIKLTSRQIDQYVNHYVAYYEQALSVNPSLKIFLELLQENHIPAGIISNGYGALQRSRLKASGIESYFTKELIFISEEIDIVKPDEKIFILAETAAGVSPSHIIFFGDDFENDIAPAQKRGWRTVLLETF